MTLSSMTGFARVSDEADWGRWVWEAKSVNNKGLDIRLNLPSGLEALEPRLKAFLAKQFGRGSFQISLKIDTGESASTLRVNQAALNTLIDTYERIDGTLATGAALATLMGIKGVVEVEAGRAQDLSAQPDTLEQLYKCAEQCLSDLRISRLSEGEALFATLTGQLSELSTIVTTATELARAQLGELKRRLSERINELLIDQTIAEDRLAAEVAIMTAKADVTEELDRLTAHIASGTQLLNKEGPVGRNLGFLAQELNREANTLCSKSASLELTNCGLALKSVIDQFKEQAANVE